MMRGMKNKLRKVLASLAFSFLLLSEGLAADYYWVGGTGNWTDPNHWATSPGGSTKHVSAPTILDNVIFDAGSFTGPMQVVTIPSDVSCLNMIWLGFANSPTLRGAGTLKLTVAGNINISGTMTWDYSGEVILTGSGPAVSINFGGNSIKSSINSKIDPSATLEIIGGFTSTKDLVISNGGLMVRNQTLRLASFQVYSAVPHTIELNNCQVYVNGGTSTAFLLANETTDLIAGNTDVFFLSGGMTINKALGSYTLRNLEADAANAAFSLANSRNTGANIALVFSRATLRSSARIEASIQYDELILTPGKSYEFKGGSLQRFNVLSASGNCSLPLFLNSLDQGTAAMFNSPNTQNITFARIKDLTASGATFNANSSSDLGNTTGWNFGPGSAGTTLYWVGGTGRWSDPAHWSTTSGGPGLACIPTAADRVIFDNRSFSGAGQIVTVDVPLAECSDMDWGAVNVPVKFTGSANSYLEVNGSLTLSVNLDNTFSGQFIFHANGPETIITYDRPFGGSIVLDGASTAVWSLTNILDCKDIKLIGGTFRSNNWDIKTIRFESNGAAPRGLELGTSRFYTNYWSAVHMFGFATQFNNADIILQYPNAQFINSGGNLVFRRLEAMDANASIISFGGTTTFNVALFHKGARFTGTQNYDDVKFSAGFEYIFESGHTFTMGTFQATGTCQGMINFRSSGTMPATFKTTSAQMPNRIIVQNIIIDGTPYTATSSLKFGTTTNWNITNGTGRTLYWVGGSGLWEETRHWSLRSNGTGGECLPTPVDTVIFDEFSFTADGQTVQTAVGIFAQCKAFMTQPGVKFADIRLEGLEVYGSVQIQPGVKFYAERLLLNGTSANFIQLAGQAIGDLVIYGYGVGSWTLRDGIICDNITNLHGHFITANQSVQAKTLRFDNTSRGTLGSSNIVLSSTGFSTAGTFHISSPTVTMDPGDYKIEFTAMSAAAVVKGTHALANLYFSSSTGKTSLISNDGDRTYPIVRYKSVIFNNNALIRGAHSIDTLIGSAGKTYELESGVTQRINRYLEIRGNNCNRSSLVATTANTAATIQGPSTLKVVMDWILFTDQNATGGAAFNAPNSLKVRNVTGWNTTANPVATASGILGPDQVLCPGTPLILNEYRQIGALGYRWTNNVTSDTFAVNSPGMYTVEAFFGAGCTLPDTIQVVAGKNVAFELGPDTIVCNLNYSLNSGLSDTSNTYRWAHNVNLDMPNIVVTTSGLYQLTVLSPDGCSFTDDVNIRLRTPPNVTTQPNYDFCAGDSVLVDPQIQTASILYWSDPRLAGATIAFKQPGNYYVHVLDNTTGCRDTSYFTITEVPIPSFTLGPDTTACDGTPISLVPDSIPFGATFLWSNGNTNSSLSVTQSGTYSLTVTDRGCDYIASRAVTMQTVNQIRLPDTAICAGDTLHVDLAAYGLTGGTAMWQPGNLTNLRQVFFNSDTISLQYTSGSCITHDTFILRVHPPLKVDLGLQDTTLCAGSSLDLNAVTPGAVSYLWQDNNTSSARTVSAAGTYRVTVTSREGCQSVDSVTVNILQGGGLNLNDIFLCDGQDTLIDLGLPSASVLWSTGAVTDTVRLSMPGTYGVTVTQGLCQDSASFTLIQSTAPLQDLGADTILCAGQSITLVPDLTVPGTTWTWDDGSSTASRLINQAGTYWITAVAGGCTASDTIMVNIIDNSNSLNLNDTTICAGDSLVIDLGATSGPVTWSHGPTTARVTLLSAGNYQVTVSLGMCDAMDELNLSITPLPIQDLGPDTTLCSGQSLTLAVDTSVPGATWTWEDGSTSSSRLVDSAGVYVLTASAQGCAFTDSVLISLIDNSQNGVNLGDTAICHTDTLRLDLRLGGLNAVWSDGQRGPVAIFNVAGTYSVSISQGVCSSSDTFDLLVMTAPVQNLGADTVLCIGESITLTANDALPGTSWQWEDGSSALTRLIDSSGVYRITAMANGCVAEDSILVTVVDNSSNFIDIRDTAICAADTLWLNLGLTGVQITWSNGQIGPLAAFDQDGQYYVDIVQGTCSTTDTFALIVKPLPSFDLGPDSTICSTLTYPLAPGPFPPGTTLIWQDGVTLASRDIHVSARYSLIAELDGCTYSDSALIQFVDPQKLDIAPSYDYCAGNPFSISIAGNNLVWSNGQTGPNFSTTTPGEFKVTSFDGYCTTYDTFMVVEVPVPIFSLGPDTIVCEGSRLSWDLSHLNAQSYLWQDSSTASAFSAAFIGPGVVKLEAINFTAANLRCYHTDSIQIQVITNPIFSLGNDIVLCPEDDVLLTLPSGLPGSIIWNDGSTNSTLLVNTAGAYSAVVDNQGCMHSDTVRVEVQKVDPVNLGVDTILCLGSRLELNAEVPNGVYSWNTGATSPKLMVTQTGQYTVNVLNGLCVVSDSVLVTFENCNLVDIFIPNIFSPNGDGVNDHFSAHAAADIQVLEFQMVIADRWGNIVYTSTAMDQTWDGRMQNHDLYPGVYVYTAKMRYRKLNIEKALQLQGDVTIIR